MVIPEKYREIFSLIIAGNATANKLKAITINKHNQLLLSILFFDLLILYLIKNVFYVYTIPLELYNHFLLHTPYNIACIQTALLD